MVQVRHNLTGKQLQYFSRCARIKNITLSALLRRLIVAISEEQMISAVLDDEASRLRHKSEHPYRPQEGNAT